MAQLDFPDNPIVGETYGAAGVVWRWDGTRWASTSGGAYPRGRVAYAQSTVFQGSITSVVDIGGLSVTWVADPTRTYRISMQGEVASSATNDVIAINMVTSLGASLTRHEIRSVGGWGDTVSASVVKTGLSGSQTVKINCGRAVGTGTLTWQADPAYPSYLLVEDITYDASVGANTAPIGTVFYSTFTAPALVAGSVNACTLHSPGSVTLVTGAMYVGTVCGGPFQGAVTQAAWGCGPFGAWWQKPVAGWSSFVSSVPVSGNATTYNLTTINLGDPAVAVSGGGGSFFRVERVK